MHITYMEFLVILYVNEKLLWCTIRYKCLQDFTRTNENTKYYAIGLVIPTKCSELSVMSC